ncbi:hypothetical protein CMEL01_14480 [Colletotrichum melonis]|uniref:Uncharacterized protein n=1 Tax=Colletotrichum melonis TaxID=1209925 RepID=A0AAI9UT03_9PEZI|nr:hypothetical protein CMEL01_14480 [Colletotrichum melonis]
MPVSLEKGSQLSSTNSIGTAMRYVEGESCFSAATTAARTPDARRRAVRIPLSRESNLRCVYQSIQTPGVSIELSVCKNSRSGSSLIQQQNIRDVEVGKSQFSFQYPKVWTSGEQGRMTTSRYKPRAEASRFSSRGSERRTVGGKLACVRERSLRRAEFPNRTHPVNTGEGSAIVSWSLGRLGHGPMGARLQSANSYELASRLHRCMVCDPSNGHNALNVG